MGDKRIQGVTWGYTWLQGATRRLKVVARSYKRLERVTLGYRGLQSVTHGYTCLQGVARGLKVVARGYKRLERVTGS